MARTLLLPGDPAPAMKRCLPSLGRHFNSISSDVWKDETVQGVTNCYSYALNCPEMGSAQPGSVSDMSRFLFSPRVVTVPIMQKRLQDDGLQEITWGEVQKGEGHIIAMRLRYKSDFHFLRREKNGLWTHKPGDGVVTDTLGLNEKIHDPRRWPDHTYPQFVGFYKIPDDGIDYLPCFKLQL